MHKAQKRDISITGEEIFLPTSPEELGNNGMERERVTSLDTTVDFSPLPTKPEEIE